MPGTRMLFERSVEFYFEREDIDWTLTDYALLLIMTDRQLTDALTADRHCVQAGFRALLLAA